MATTCGIHFNHQGICFAVVKNHRIRTYGYCPIIQSVQQTLLYLQQEYRWLRRSSWVCSASINQVIFQQWSFRSRISQSQARTHIRSTISHPCEIDLITWTSEENKTHLTSDSLHTLHHIGCVEIPKETAQQIMLPFNRKPVRLDVDILAWIRLFHGYSPCSIYGIMFEHPCSVCYITVQYPWILSVQYIQKDDLNSCVLQSIAQYPHRWECALWLLDPSILYQYINESMRSVCRWITYQDIFDHHRMHSVTPSISLFTALGLAIP